MQNPDISLSKSKMNIVELKKLIKKNLERKKANIEKFEWDSLAHLAILMDLEKKFPGKINKILKISEANSFKKLSKTLLKGKIIKK